MQAILQPVTAARMSSARLLGSWPQVLLFGLLHGWAACAAACWPIVVDAHIHRCRTCTDGRGCLHGKLASSPVCWYLCASSSPLGSDPGTGAHAPDGTVGCSSLCKHLTSHQCCSAPPPASTHPNRCRSTQRSMSKLRGHAIFNQNLSLLHAAPRLGTPSSGHVLWARAAAWGFHSSHALAPPRRTIRGTAKEPLPTTYTPSLACPFHPQQSPGTMQGLSSAPAALQLHACSASRAIAASPTLAPLPAAAACSADSAAINALSLPLLPYPLPLSHSLPEASPCSLSLQQEPPTCCRTCSRWLPPASGAGRGLGRGDARCRLLLQDLADEVAPAAAHVASDLHPVPVVGGSNG
jgi:hypothetical protein